MIPELRRKINDSYIGQKINHTIPGILVEGASRIVSDLFKILKYEAIDNYADDRFEAIRACFDDMANEMDPRKHYSHTSPVYRQIIKNGELAGMARIPITYALYPDLKPKDEENLVCWSE